VISSMREYFKGLKFILVIVVIAFVATSVIYFGTGNTGSGGTPNIVGTVNGEEIPTERFRRTQANLIEQYERMTRQRLTPEMIDRMGLNQRVMNELVNDTMIVQAAAREGVRVSDDELRARIQDMREFHQDGRFSRDRYLRVLKQVRLEPGSFEAEMRRQLIRKKIEDLVKDGVKVSGAELQEAYSARNQRVRMAWASIETTPLMAGVTVPDADLEPYVKTHQPQFTRPERRRIQYVVVSTPVPAAAVSDQDAQAYYDSNPKEYEQLPEVHAAHILVRVPPVGGSEAENKAKEKIEDVLKRARAGEDFAKLAKEVSEDTANAQQGGDLGFVKRGDLVAPFENAAFALKKGELAPAPVRTPFGYHAIKVLDVKEGGRTPFKDVAGAIKAKLAAKRAEEEASKKAGADQAKLLATKDFAAEVRTLDLPLREATVGRGDTIVGIGRDPKIDEAIFSLAVGGTSEPIKVPNGFAIIRVVQHSPAGVPPLEEIKPLVIDAIKRERAEAIAMDRAKALVAAVGKGGDFLTTAKADGFATGETPLFSKAEPPKDARLPGGVMVAALQTPTGQISEPVKTGTAVYVVKTLERQPADVAGFDKQREELEKQTLEQKRTQAWDAWIESQKLVSKIDLNPTPTAVR
jgi:peptidyl-prolyl cis-trans isomerase D